ncbi:hypothetical protein [Nocardioides sp.]|uniref:hypothetical protein n=1 Tax=Nocardioides sp. TaxID=35761 RepID=UPI0035B29B81
MSPHIAAIILIADLALAGIVIFWRGATQGTRHYTWADAIGGVIECAFLIWLVTVIAS